MEKETSSPGPVGVADLGMVGSTIARTFVEAGVPPTGYEDLVGLIGTAAGTGYSAALLEAIESFNREIRQAPSQSQAQLGIVPADPVLEEAR